MKEQLLDRLPPSIREAIPKEDIEKMPPTVTRSLVE